MPTFREDPKIGSKVPLIKTADLNDKSVTEKKLADGSITKDKIATGAVTSEKLQHNAVTTETISDGAVTAEKIAEGAVSVDEIKDLAVTNAKIADESVSAEKLQSGLRSTIVSTHDKAIELDKKKANVADVDYALECLENKIGDRVVVEGNVTNLPDDEDLTSVQVDGREIMKLNDRAYEPSNFSGKGYKILRKNIQRLNLPTVTILVSNIPSSSGDIAITINGKTTTVALDVTTDTTTAIIATKIGTALKSSLDDYDVSVSSSTIVLTRNNSKYASPSSIDVGNTTAGITVKDSITKSERKNVLTQDMINKPNTVYEIRYDFDLNGAEISIKDNCVLKFNGGSLNNGKIKNGLYYRGNIKGTAVYLSSVRTDNSNVFECTAPLYYNILRGNLVNYYNTSLSEDLDIYKKLDRYSLIENIVFRNDILHKGIAVTTEGATAPQENTIRKTIFERYNIGIQYLKNGYSTIHDCTFYKNNRSIVIDNGDKWIGSLFISNCHIIQSSIGIETSKVAVLKLDNITIENCDTSLHLGGNITAKNIYIGDQANKEVSLRGVVIKEGANIIIKDSSLGLSAPSSSSLEHYLFELQGTDDSPCTLTLINCSINLTNQYAANLYLFKSNSSKNIIRFDNVTVYHGTVNVQHSYAVATIVDNAIIPVNESIKNYILNGYFDDDYINNTLIDQGVQKVDIQSLYSNIAFKYSKQSVIFFYHIPKEYVNKRMYLEIGVTNKDPNAIVTLNTSSDITTSNIELSSLGYAPSKIVSNKFTVVPTKETGKIIFNNIPYNPDKSSNITISFAKLYSVENKNILDKGSYYSHNRVTDKNALIHNFSTYSNIDGGHILDNNEKIVSIKDSILKLNTEALSLKEASNIVQEKNSIFVKDGSLYFTDVNKSVYKISDSTKKYGSSTDRPASGLSQGFQYFDTTLNKPIWWTGSKWVDASGADV